MLTQRWLDSTKELVKQNTEPLSAEWSLKQAVINLASKFTKQDTSILNRK